MSQAVFVRTNGDASVMQLESVEVAAPASGEVRIRQEAIGLNAVDIMVRDGRFPMPLPAVIGFEGAGVIESIGPDVEEFRVGDRVAYFFSPGAYATHRLIAATALVSLPNDITTRQAAAYLAKGLTAWMAMRALHHLAPGETVLVQGASGSVGSVLSRWARSLGAKVIGVAGSAGKLAKVAAAADVALLSSDPDFLAKVHAVSPQGVDVVYEMVGNATFEKSVAAVKEGGTIVSIGAASGQPQVDRTLLARKRIVLTGGGTPEHVNASNLKGISSQLFEALWAGLFDDIPIVTYALADAHKAHQDLESHRLQGLPVLLPFG